MCGKSLHCKFTDGYKDTLGNADTYNEQCGSGNSATLYSVFLTIQSFVFQANNVCLHKITLQANKSCGALPFLALTHRQG